MTTDRAENLSKNRAIELAASTDTKGFSLGEYWRTIRKRQTLAVSVALAIIVSVVLWTYRQPKMFSSSVSIVIDPSAPQVLQGVKDVVEMGAGSYWANREFYETQYRVIRSKELAQRVVDRLALASDPSFPWPNAKDGSTPVDLAAAIVSETSVEPVKDSRIANLTVLDRSPVRAAQIANTLAQLYIEGNLEYKLEGARDATTWLGDQVGSLATKLKHSEFAVYEFKNRHQLLDASLDDKQNITGQTVQTYSQKLTDVRAKKAELEAVRKQIVRARDNLEEQESLPDIRQNTVIQQLRVLYVDLTKTRAELEARYGDKHPNIAAIERKISAVQHDYTREIGNVLKSMEKTYETTLDQEKALLRLIEQSKREAIELTKLEVEYRPLVREAENDQKLYTLLIQREKEIGLTGLIRTNNVRILDPAIPNLKPVKPRVFLNILLGIFAGVMLGIGAAFAVEALDNTLKTQEQTELILGVPVLGLVPIIGPRDGKKGRPTADPSARDLGVHLDPKSAAAEACRSIRTNLLFLSPDRPLKSLVVTSPGPQEGKTTTAISLAITLAQSGARVLLVDTDLRRPRIHKSFAIKNDRGISNLIVGDGTLGETVITTSIPNLDVLPCGPYPPNPAELLHTERFAEIMRACGQAYDRVIYDSPPTSAVTDPAVIGNLSDGVILVVRAGHTSRDAAAFARRQLTDAKARILGAIVNRVDLNDRTYNYYYSGYYRRYQYGTYYGAKEDGAKA